MTEKTPQQIKQAELDAMKAEYEAVVTALEERLVAFALEHDLFLNLGEYGSGRTLQLMDDSYYGVSRGEWLYSSATC